MKPFFTVREMKRGDWGVFAGETCTGTHPTKEIAEDVAYGLNGEYETSIKPLVTSLEAARDVLPTNAILLKTGNRLLYEIDAVLGAYK